MPSYTWSDIPSSEPVTSDLTQAVISYGEQPATQLSLDYVMHEDYGGNLAVKAGDGTWAEGPGGDGAYRNGARWEPICNCPGVGTRWNTIGMTGQDTMLMSQSWLGAIDAGTLDILIFIEGGNLETESVVARYARQVAELAPSFRGRFGQTVFPLTVNATAFGAPAVARPANPKTLVGGMAEYRLRAAVWEETPVAPAVVCAHVVVVNLDEEQPLNFQYKLGGQPPPRAPKPITSERIFGMGNRVKHNVTSSSGDQWISVMEWLGPSETGIYRVGCEATPLQKPRKNLATISLETPALQQPQGWSLPAYGGIDPLVRIVSDSAVATEGRHSTKVLLPNSKPIVIPLSGSQLVPQKAGYGWGEKTTGVRIARPPFSYSNVILRVAVQTAYHGVVVSL
eukprot:SAG31_NODE_3019_length_4784_cov_2.199360_4_plen_396_part_00